MWEGFVLPFAITWVLIQLPPTIMEVYRYYTCGGTTRLDMYWHDDSMTQNYMGGFDLQIYVKRFVDRPTSEAAKAFYGYLDWSAAMYDKNFTLLRRRRQRIDGESSFWFPTILGPFVFNFPVKQWFRGDDAACVGGPVWGNGGRERAFAEYEAAKQKCLKKHWHYRIMRKVRREQEQQAALQAKARAAAGGGAAAAMPSEN